MSSPIHLFGVRHHGPGSARSLVNALTALSPACVLIEGPPEANGILPLAAHEALEPPVALLIHQPDEPRSGVMYPFAKFSPEWQAIRYGLARRVPVRFIDLPSSVREDTPQERAVADPLAEMARAGGYSETERWWDQLVESRSGRDLEVFAALHEMMTQVRERLDPEAPLHERRREAHMRQGIRAAQAEGLAPIAVVCGAYHTPALQDLGAVPADQVLLADLPKSRREAAWVPWTYEHLSIASGYGAGIESPLWYELLWERRRALGAAWITRAARLLREADVPISAAHVIETCRLADTLSALRGRPIPGLPEYQDASVSVLGNGEARNLQLIERRWHFDERMGRVPPDFPAAPLQRDLAAAQKRLRLKESAEEKTLNLDLREETDRQRSVLLRRLRILGVEWGKEVTQVAGGRKSSFHEDWVLQWEPQLTIRLIEASRLGHTLEQAATAGLLEKARGTRELTGLVARLHDALLADLPEGLAALVAAIKEEAAASTDVPALLKSVPPLADVQRYGNVRGTDTGMVAQILAGLVPRLLIGLPGACTGLDDDAAHAMWKQVRAAGPSLEILGEPHLTGWHETLRKIAAGPATHPLLAGCAMRLLYDARKINLPELAQAMSLALSAGALPALAAAWVEGLLSGGAALLQHDERLRQLLDDWVRGITPDHFVQTLPLLRRTFAQVAAAERRMLGQQLAARHAPARPGTAVVDLDVTAAEAVLPVLRLIWNKEPA